MRTLTSRAPPGERCPREGQIYNSKCIEPHLRVESGRHPAPATLSETSEILMDVRHDLADVGSAQDSGIVLKWLWIITD